MNIHIDPEFKNLIPSLTQDEYAGLEESIVNEGCRDAIVLWKDIIVDGHNRYEICVNHNVSFKTIQKEFADRDEVKLWMMRNQLSRRNLNDFQRVEITHKCEDAVKKKTEENRLATLKQNATSEVKILPPRDIVGKSRDILGAMAGVSGLSYERAVTVLEEAPEQIVEAARRNDISINAAYQATRLEPEHQEEIVDRIEQGESAKEVIKEIKNRPHVTNNSGNNEWYTPAEYIELAREVLGIIDIDPASCEYANETVKAKKYYSIDDDGLTKTWNGKVWMNPPYSADLVGKFADKFVSEFVVNHISEGIVLVNNATETSWFNKLISVASAVSFPKGRIRYKSPTLESNTPLQGQAFIYFGDNSDKFCNSFSDIGWCAKIWGDMK